MKSFKPYPNEHDSLKQTRERRKKPCNFEQKIPMKILSHYSVYFLQKKKFTVLERFAKPFPTKRKPSKCPTKEKRGKKSKRSREERKRKVKDEGAAKLSFCACPNFKSCNLASGTKASLVLDL